MQTKKINSQNYLIRLQKGEKILEQLKKFCLENEVEGGFFYGLGAVSFVELALYNVETKKYYSQKFEQALEMTNITGSIGYLEKELIIHSHATFSDEKMQAIGGHLVEAVISGTAEIYFQILPKLTKKYDEETGLKLFDFI